MADEITEGDLIAARSDTNIDRMPGHTGNLTEWEASEAGQKFLNEEAPANEKRMADEAAAVEASQADTEKKFARYEEAVQKAADQAQADSAKTTDKTTKG